MVLVVFMAYWSQGVVIASVRESGLAEVVDLVSFVRYGHMVSLMIV